MKKVIYLYSLPRWKTKKLTSMIGEIVEYKLDGTVIVRYPAMMYIGYGLNMKCFLCIRRSLKSFKEVL